MKDIKLTDAESRAVAENHNLIYWYANYKQLNIDDWYDLLAIELCYTIQKYDKSKGKLSSFYKLRANNMVSNEFRLNSRIKRKGVLISIDNDDFKLNIEDTDSVDIIAQYITDIENDNSLDKKVKDVLLYKLKGYTQTEISKMLNISQPMISRIVGNYKRIYEESKE